ncbi:hypothetical protein HK098_001017 [Nowakowskiella sp. JEL0407]|nr:hypothetical protein HK098_001017 [Nowakowskiella sp. JEL0407]
MHCTSKIELERFSILGHNFGNDGFVEDLRVFFGKDPNIHKFDISTENAEDEDGILDGVIVKVGTILSSSLKLKSIVCQYWTIMDVSMSHFANSYGDLAPFFRELCLNTCLKMLDLSYTTLTGSLHVAKMLKINTTWTKVVLNECKLRPEECVNIANGAFENEAMIGQQRVVELKMNSEQLLRLPVSLIVGMWSHYIFGLDSKKTVEFGCRKKKREYS